MPNEPSQFSRGVFAVANASERVRMGPVSLVALVVIISLAVLSLLAFSTGNASLVLSQRQADSVAAAYGNERAAQEFLADMDAVLASVRADHAERGEEPTAGSNASASANANEGSPAMRLVEEALDGLLLSAEEAADGVTATASVQGTMVQAAFSAGDGRALNVTVAVRDDGTYQIEAWKATAVQNEEQPSGQLLIVK